MTTTSTRRNFLVTLTGLSLGAAAGLGALGGGVAEAAQRAAPRGRRVEVYIKQLRRQGLIEADERTAWSVYDFTGGRKLVSINENVPYQSASMLKPFIAQAYFFRHRQNPKRYPYNDRVEQLMERMIRRSSNSATNELMQRCGRGRSTRPDDVERLLKAHAGSIFRNLSLVEFIPRNGRTYRNRASARDYSRFLYALWNERLPHAREIKHFMKLSNPDRILQGVPVIPDPPTEVLDKTGSTARLCGNMGILVGRDGNGVQYPYTVIGVIEKRRRARHYGRWIRQRSNVIRGVSGLAYETMRERYRLV